MPISSSRKLSFIHENNDDKDNHGFDAVILSDLLHFDASYVILIDTVKIFLKRSEDARAFVSVSPSLHHLFCLNSIRVLLNALHRQENTLSHTT
jgi:hypothetical protein